MLQGLTSSQFWRWVERVTIAGIASNTNQAIQMIEAGASDVISRAPRIIRNYFQRYITAPENIPLPDEKMDVDRKSPTYGPLNKMKRKSYAFAPHYVGKTFSGRTKFGDKYNRKYIESFVEKTEINSTVSDTDVVYVGIGINYEKITTGVCRTILKCLLDVSGQKITDFNAEVIGTYRINFVYYQEITSTSITTATITLGGANQTLFAMANTLKAGIVTSMPISVPLISSIELQQITDGGTGYTTVSHINANQLKIQCVTSQALLIQNRTLGTDAGATDVDYSALNVTNNPICGYVWSKKGNIINPKVKSETTNATYKPFCTYDDSLPEVFNRKGSEQWVNSPNQLAQTMESCNSFGKFVLQPGQMKKINQSIVWKKHLNWYFQTFFAVFAADNPSVHKRPGNIKLLGFDKMLAGDSPEITIGYELNQTTRFDYYIKKDEKTLPIYS